MVTVVIPAYNEAARLPEVLRGLLAQGFNELVVVDDGSSDNTSQVAASAGATVLRHAINRGQGAALETGNEYCRRSGASVVVHFDADGQFNPADIAGAIQALNDNQVDVVLGSRFLDSRSQLPWSKRYILLPLSRLMERWLTGIRLSDSQNGFRVLSRRALEDITLTQDRMAHNSELIATLKKKQLSFVEHPVEVRYHRYGLGVVGGFKIISDWIWGKIS